MGLSFGYPQFQNPLDPINLDVRRCAVPRGRASGRVLIVRLGGMGDVLMGSPMLHALRDAHPDSHITWMVEYTALDAVDASPYVDELLVWDSMFWKRMMRRALLPLWLARALRFRKALDERRYDTLISYQPEEWPLLTRALGAKTRIGVFDTFRQTNRDRPTSRNSRLYTHAYVYNDLPAHRAEQYLLPLKALGLPIDASRRMSMGFTQGDSDAVDGFLSKRNVSADAPLTIIAPLTTWVTRCWEAGRYAELANRLARRSRVVLIGSAKEREQIESIARGVSTPVLIAAGDLTFRQMAALIARAKIVVSGDTGPMHVAAAVGTPYVALFGPTAPAARAPLEGDGISISHSVPCGPCDQKVCGNIASEDYLSCMKLIAVDEVEAAVLAKIGARA